MKMLGIEVGNGILLIDPAVALRLQVDSVEVKFHKCGSAPGFVKRLP